MRLADFENMVRQLCKEVPTHFFDGIAEVVVSPRIVPHPDRSEIFTLGECVPLPVQVGTGSDGIQSRILLYHGSFNALAQLQEDFDWRHEAWQTLTHELRHHLEWRAHAPDLENLDWAVEQNFARQDGEPFDSSFYLSGEVLADGTYLVEDDAFIEQIVDSVPSDLVLNWQGETYPLVIPEGTRLPCFLTIEGVMNPPEGELVLVLRRKPGVRDLFLAPEVFQAPVRVTSWQDIFPG
jgi:hypothetical protein